MGVEGVVERVCLGGKEGWNEPVVIIEHFSVQIKQVVPLSRQCDWHDGFPLRR